MKRQGRRRDGEEVEGGDPHNHLKTMNKFVGSMAAAAVLAIGIVSAAAPAKAQYACISTGSRMAGRICGVKGSGVFQVDFEDGSVMYGNCRTGARYEGMSYPIANDYFTAVCGVGLRH